MMEEEAPRFWRVPGSSDGAVMYVAHGRTYLVARGHVYTYYAPDDGAYASEDEERTELASGVGVWREIKMPEVRGFELKSAP